MYTYISSCTIGNTIKYIDTNTFIVFVSCCLLPLLFCLSLGCHDVPNYIIPESSQDESSWQWTVTDSPSVTFHHQIVNTQNQLDIGQEISGIWMVDNPPHQPVTCIDRGNSFYHSFNNSFEDQGVQGYGCVCFPGPSLPGRWGGYPLFSHGRKSWFFIPSYWLPCDLFHKSVVSIFQWGRHLLLDLRWILLKR